MDEFKPNNQINNMHNIPNGNSNGIQNNERLNFDKNNLNGNIVPSINIPYDNPQDFKNPPFQANNSNFNPHIVINNAGMGNQQLIIQQQSRNPVFKNQPLNGMNPIFNNTNTSQQVINEKENCKFQLLFIINKFLFFYLSKNNNIIIIIITIIIIIIININFYNYIKLCIMILIQ